MGILEGRKILFGITGGIAAYKAAMLCRLLVREGAQVKVLMTEHAKKFITPLTMATLSGNPVLVEFFNPENGQWNSHVALGIWADLFIIAPATANTLSKMACGTADNLLLTTYLSARCPVVVAPAMDLDMYRHPATVSNLKLLSDRGVKIIDAEDGELASGLSGKGRMAEPENILEAVKGVFASGNVKSLSGRKVLITAGPTVEAIDPVRFISNHSSGKMGYAIAAAFAAEGADVTLISGPVSLSVPFGVKRIDVISAEQMCTSFLAEYSSDCDIAVFCAAVADYAPASAAERKIKKNGEELTLHLVRNRDIAAEAGKMKRPGAIHVGFALETDSEMENAREKLFRKNLDMIVMNSLRVEGSCFGTDTNQVTLIRPSGEPQVIPLSKKTLIAERIVSAVMEIQNA